VHPFLLELSRFRLPTYGVVSLCALAVAVLLVRRYARIENLDVGRTTEAIVLTIAVGYFGARLLEAVIHWDRYFGHPGGLKLLLFSTGIFLGGLITAIPFCILWFRHIGLPVLQGLDLLALAGCVAEGVGRWGCFLSGCCYGTPTDLPWAVTFPDVARRLHAGLPGVPIHPTQIYLSIDALLILGVLLLLYRRKRFHGQIMSVYVLLYTITRFFIEFVRGDADRGFAFGGRISTSQLLGVALAVLAAASYLYLDARHRRSHEPDWRPRSHA
jgi:phosphatidylglycerol:prolipoprotein diacylglycerol transferase